MGGTIRAAYNLAGYLAPDHDVVLLSVVRRRERPFFPLPDGVRLVALDDLRAGTLGPVGRRVRALLHRVPSVLGDPRERTARLWSLWVDIRAARYLRGRRGALVTTRVALNLLAADVRPPGLVTIGLEQTHLRAHPRPLRRTMAARYPQLDALVVLT